MRRPGIDRQKALDRVCLRVGKFLRSKRNLLEISGPLQAVVAERQGGSENEYTVELLDILNTGGGVNQL